MQQTRQLIALVSPLIILCGCSNGSAGSHAGAPDSAMIMANAAGGLDDADALRREVKARYSDDPDSRLARSALQAFDEAQAAKPSMVQKTFQRGGVPDLMNEYPNCVALYGRNGLCSAVALGDGRLLSARHCVRECDPTEAGFGPRGDERIRLRLDTDSKAVHRDHPSLDACVFFLADSPREVVPLPVVGKDLDRWLSEDEGSSFFAA